jgi:hypothetical protein
VSRSAFHGLVLAPLFLLGCRTHPCGEYEADAPAKLADAPLVQEDGKICHADESNVATGSLQVMYWGDHRSELGVKYMTAFDAAGWEQCGEGQLADHRYCFEKGDVRIDLKLDQTETPRFGAKAWSPSITAFVHWYDLSLQ